MTKLRSSGSASRPTIAPRSARRVLLFMGLGLLAMLWAATDYFRTHPGLTVPAPVAKSQPAQMSSAPEQGAAQDGVMKLMQALQQNPNDLSALTTLAQHFMHLEDWVKAETFALRAMVAAPSEAGPLHLLGIIQHNQGRHQEAARSLEKSLNLANAPSTRYSLAILQAYFLNEIDKARGHLEQVLADSAAPETLKDHARDELGKLAMPKP